MPTYSYRCSACAYEFDQFQKFSEDPLTVCPECTGEIKRVIQPVGVVFKGSGWYITDSRKSNGAESTTSEKSSEDGKTKSSTKDGSSESKTPKKEPSTTPA